MNLTDSDCEGLRLYRERCQAAMPDSVRDGPWIDESDWVEANVPLQTMAEVRRQAGKDLSALNLRDGRGGVDGAPFGGFVVDRHPDSRTSDALRLGSGGARLTTPLESKGLRLFRERVERILPEEVRGQTWHAKSGWLRNCASQGPIRDIFVQLMKDLGPISQAKDETPEGRLGDEIRDVADILWYAMEEKTRERAEALVVAMTAAVKPLDLARWRPCSPLWWYGWASGRCRRHHYHDHGCALGVCRPGRARADCTRNCLTSHGVVRGWKYRNYQGSNLCSTQPAGATEMSTR